MTEDLILKKVANAIRVKLRHSIAARPIDGQSITITKNGTIWFPVQNLVEKEIFIVTISRNI